MSSRFRHLNYTNIMRFLTVGIFIGLSILLGLIFIPFKTIEINNEPFPITNAPIHAGESLSYRIDYCRFTDKPSRFTRTLEGPTLVTLVTSDGTSDVGCRVVDVVNTVVPTSVKPGTYTLKINVCIKPNYFQDRCQQVRSQPFEILDIRKDKDGNPILLNQTPSSPATYVVKDMLSIALKEKQTAPITRQQPVRNVPKTSSPPEPGTGSGTGANPRPGGHVNRGNAVVEIETRISPLTGFQEYRVVGDALWLVCNGILCVK